MSQLPPREPARLPVWDPNDDRYWDPCDLEQELYRTFQICHECRMCVTYCGSFPILFEAIDRDVDAGRAHGAERLSAMGRVSSLYVNGFNHPARRAYEKVGFTQIASFATILF